MLEMLDPCSAEDRSDQKFKIKNRARDRSKIEMLEMLEIDVFAAWSQL